MIKLSAYYLFIVRTRAQLRSYIPSLSTTCNKFLSKYFKNKIFVAGQKPRNQRKYSPSKNLGYTVVAHLVLLYTNIYH